jgi:putative toxin-antitoxin system antitoxin component (TIGR02293 family)
MEVPEYSEHMDKSKFKMREFEIGGGTAIQSQAKADAAAIEGILGLATEVIGNRQRAMTWLGTPLRGLGFATPISLLGTKMGKEEVTDILGQMEHGIW